MLDTIPAGGISTTTSLGSGAVTNAPYGLASNLARHVDGQAAPCDPRMFVTRMVGTLGRLTRDLQLSRDLDTWVTGPRRAALWRWTRGWLGQRHTTLGCSSRGGSYGTEPI
uniref:(northern house mosquito) hypothetical protein n=1 Tax=Culex pipiens TaxID=7175 RepID=A0A8D8AWB5_CULPI